MKAQIFAGTAILTLIVYPAFGDLPVIDLSNLEQWGISIPISQQTLTTAINSFNTITQLTGIAGHIWSDVEELVGADKWAPGMGNNPMPFTAVQGPAYFGGFADPTALPYGPAYFQQNTVGDDMTHAALADGTFVGAELLRGIMTISSVQATNNNHLDDLEHRLEAVIDIMNQLAKAETLQETNSINARWHQEQHNLQAQIAQAIQVNTAASMQMHAYQYDQRQWQFMDEMNGIENACASVAASGSTLQLPVCH